MLGVLQRRTADAIVRHYAERRIVCDRPSAHGCKNRLEPFAVSQQVAAVLDLNECFGEVAVTDKKIRCISPRAKPVAERDRYGLCKDVSVRVEKTCEGDEVSFQCALMLCGP